MNKIYVDRTKKKNCPAIPRYTEIASLVDDNKHNKLSNHFLLSTFE